MNHKQPSSHFIRKFTKKETPEGQSSVQLIVTHWRSKYVDYHLQPEVCKLKSYTKDSTDAMNKLAEIKSEITEHDILVTMDVHSLYTNIPNDEGMQAVREKLNNSPSRIPTRVITTFLLLFLTLNNFIFNGVNYLQTLGCAMGTICAPSYANIFMGRFGETLTKLLHKSHFW